MRLQTKKEKFDTQESEDANDEEVKQIMKFWVVNMCKECIDKSKWDHKRYTIPKSVELTDEEKFNLHELYTYDKFKWMAETKSLGVSAPFYDKRCSFGEKMFNYIENFEEEE